MTQQLLSRSLLTSGEDRQISKHLQRFGKNYNNQIAQTLGC